MFLIHPHFIKLVFMRILKIDRKSGEVKLIPECLEDLWHIERVLEEGDIVSARSKRKYKPSEGAEGEKKPVKIDLGAEKIEFSKFANRIRVTGKIKGGTPEEYIQIGSYHTIDIETGKPVTIAKRWRGYQIDRLKKAVKETKRPRVGIVVMDERKALFALLKGYGVEYGVEISSAASKGGEKHEEKTRQYYGDILKKIEMLKVGRIVIAGPGFAKDGMKKFIKGKNPGLLKKITFGTCSYAERSGVNELLKSGVMSKIAAAERIEGEMVLMERFKAEIGKESGLAAYGYEEVRKAVGYGALSDLFIVDELLRKEKRIEGLLEEAEKKRVKITIFSKDSDSGNELSGFGGIAGLLRFKIR